MMRLKQIHNHPVLNLKLMLQLRNLLQLHRQAHQLKKRLLLTQSTRNSFINKSGNLIKLDINSLKKIQMLRCQATLQLREFSKNKKKLANKQNKKRKKKLKRPRGSMRRCLVPLNPLEVIHSALM